MEERLLDATSGRAPAEEPAPVVVERRADGTLAATARGLTLTVGRAGEGFRSVELLLAALGSCMLGTMLVFAENAGVALDGVRLELEPVLAERPERVESVRLRLVLDGEVEERRLASLRRVAERCKVHSTLERGVGFELEVECRRR